MPQACSRCGRPGEAPPAHRVPFAPEAKQKVLGSICASCWTEWEDMEVKVINEYRLNFLDPEHRSMLQRTCLEFLKLPA
jgi:Fe-S cluster biosynthesis and repair protein YggX